MPHFTPDNFHNCHLGLLLGRAAILKDRIIDTHMEPHGITAAQFKVLIIMAQFGVDTPAELCRNLSLDSGSMTRMLDRLVCKGWIERLPNPTDKRGVLVQLTPDGAALCEQCHQVVGQKLHQELTKNLSTDEVATLECLLKKVLS